MASLPPLPSAKKRRTLAERLDRLPDANEDEQEELKNEIEKQSAEYKGFRHHAERSKRRQDHHLREYTKWLLWYKKHPEGYFSDSELDELLFPVDPNEYSRMYEQFRLFLLFVFKLTEPRSRASGQHIQYRTLVQYRESLVFWVRYKARMRDAEFPPNQKMFYVMTEAMRGVMRAFPNKQGGLNKEKPYLGLAELRELYDHDAVHCRSIEYAEQHWAAWALGRLTACRPGSICVSGGGARNPGLVWDNIEFFFGDEMGQIDMVVHFENINIKRPDDPELHTLRSGGGDNSLHVTIKSPDPSNLIFSPAHRLLVIAIRRKLVVGVEKIEDLWELNTRRIFLKLEAANQPLFFAGLPKGAGIDMTRPLRANALSDYLAKTGRQVGWLFDVLGFVPLRRRALTDIVTRLGKDAARRIAGHSPESHTLERYYLQVGYSFQQTNTLLEQPFDKGDQQAQSDEARLMWAPLATGKLSDAAIKRTRGVALREMTNRLALAGEDYPEDLSTDSIRQYRKRLRRIAQKALFEHEQKQARITREEYQKRKDSLAASSFADAVLKRALELRKAADDDEDIEMGEGDEDEDGDYDDEFEGFGDDDGGQGVGDAEDAEDDLEDSFDPTNNNITITPEEEMAMEDDSVDDVLYRDLATAFMETLMDNSMNSIEPPWDARDRTCPECMEDETVSVQKKAFEYRDEGHYLNHLNGNFHTAGKKFERAAEGRHSENPDEGYICILCEQSEEDRLHHFGDGQVPTKKFSKLYRLMAHVRESTAKSHGQKHDELQALAGFYDPALAPRKDPQTEIKAAQAREKDLKRMGIEVVKLHPASGIDPHPHPHMPGLVRGMPKSDGIPAKFATSVNTGQPQSHQPQLPLKFATSLQYGAPPASSGIPLAFQDSLTLGSVASGPVSTPARTSAMPGPSRKSAPRPPPVDPNARRISLGTSSMARPSNLKTPILLSDNSKSSSLEDDEEEEDDENLFVGE